MKVTITLSEVETHEGRIFIAVFERYKERRAIVTAGEDMVIVEAQGAVHQIFGWGKKELVGKKVDVLMAPRYAAQHDGFVKRYVETGVARAVGKVRNVQGKHRVKPETFPIALQLEEEYDPQPDGTKKRVFRAILTPTSSYEVTVTLDLEGMVQSASDDFLILFGYDKKDVVGCYIDKLVKCDLKTLVAASKRLKEEPDSLRQHVAFTRDVVAIHSDGSLFSARIDLQSFTSSTSDLINEPGTLLFRCCITRVGDKKDTETVYQGQLMGNYQYGRTLVRDQIHGNFFRVLIAVLGFGFLWKSPPGYAQVDWRRSCNQNLATEAI